MNEHESRNEERGGQHIGLVFGKRGKGNRSGLVAGLVIVALGLILLLDTEGLVPAWDLWRFWPVVLIALGLVRVIRGGATPEKLWGVVEVGFGVVFLLGALGYQHFTLSHTWPLLIVAAGLRVLYEKFGKPERVARLESNLDLNRADVFGGGKVRVSSKNFRGGKWLAVFGGSEIDFRNADMEGTQATLEIVAVFGGGEIIVPRNWEVQVHGVAFLGGHSDETERPFPDSGPRKILVIKGAWVMGGFSIKN